MRDWDEVNFDPGLHQARPRPYFLVLSMPAPMLRSLAGIHRRDVSAGAPRAEDTNIQRRHDVDRSEEIRRFVQGGYPWSSLSEAQRTAGTAQDLRKPGWLPTAVVVNLVEVGAKRQGRTLDPRDAITIHEDVRGEAGELVTVALPATWKNTGWTPTGTHPIEVIDGQHRLWAFDDERDTGVNYSLPVVAFIGLDISWQAYLFWTINIKPKKINASLAFDLYPLLREQEWLEAGEGLNVYRETRAQELTEALWSTPLSPWYQRINMLGDTGVRASQPVTQAAFIRNLVAAFIKSWGRRGKLGGLFGGSGTDEGLAWTRVQQAAFLVLAWKLLADSVAATDSGWAQELRQHEQFGQSDLDPAFTSQYSLLASDQGIRAILNIFNDMTYVSADDLRLSEWTSDEVPDNVTPDSIQSAVASLEARPVAKFLHRLTGCLATYDWRTAKTPSLSPEDKRQKLVFRGSGGYRELRLQLLAHLENCSDPDISRRAGDVLELLRP